MPPQETKHLLRRLCFGALSRVALPRPEAVLLCATIEAGYMFLYFNILVLRGGARRGIIWVINYRGEKMYISDIKVDRLSCPIGIDNGSPCFEYIINSHLQNTVQTKCAVTVLKGNKAVWKYLRKNREQSVCYKGKLEPRTKYKVSIRVWDNYGNKAQGDTFFETGLMGESMGGFITYPASAAKADRPSFCPIFKKDFDTNKIKNARMYISAQGLYMAHINGKRVGEDYFTPGCTAYDKRLQYQVYDVTSLIRSGKNTLSITTAPGWFCGPFGCVERVKVYGDRPAAACRLHLELTNGTQKDIYTDQSWTWGEGHILFSEREAGEIQDTRLDESFFGGVELLAYNAEIVASVSEPVRIMHRLPVKNVITTPGGKTVLDFGQNLSGFVSFKVKGKKGSRVVLKHCEVLDKNGEIYTENLRTAACTDEYILNGKKQTLRPNFTFHGFRYCQVEGIKNINSEDFTACVLYTNMEQTGYFECSEPKINKLFENIIWSQRGNFIDIPTDCPQRDERLGWTGDAQVFAPTAAFNMDVSAFFNKWLADLYAQSSLEKGVPHMVPDLFESIGAAAWGDAATVIPTVLYKVYGNKHMLAKHYDGMKQWVDFILSRSQGYLWMQDFQYGDWLGMDREGDSRTGATDPNLVANAYFAHSASLVAKAAKELGKKEDAAYYANLSNKVKKAFCDEYLTKNGRLVSDTQTACTLALYFDMVPKDKRARILESLVANLERHDNHMVTGFVGTPILLKCLSQNGRHDIAAKLLFNEDYPSWLYAVNLGATTIWERWNGIKPDGSFEDHNMNSFNHYAYGSVGDWLYSCVVGITPKSPGYREISFAPTITHGMQSARAKLKTVHGVAECGWSINDGEITVSITVPCNTTAELVMPVSRKLYCIGSGSYTFTERQ